jgi:hypothetical protein
VETRDRGGSEAVSVEVLDENVVSKDGEALTVGGAAEGQVADPIAAATRVVDHKNATRQIFQTAIRAAVKERPSSKYGTRR